MNLKETKCSIDSLVASGKIAVTSDTDKDSFDRIKSISLDMSEVFKYGEAFKYIGVTDEFKKVIKTFDVEPGITPAGFRQEFVLGNDGSVRIDLVRDISFDKNGVRRPTNLLFSANTADPFEIATMKDLIANVTTNPQIVYSSFINNPKANINNQFKTREEVMQEICKLVGPGCDISVEVNDPFAPVEKLMEEIKEFEEIINPYRLVVKVPHTGPLNKENVADFLAGKTMNPYKGRSKDFFYGHNLAYFFKEQGYRVNFTLMSDPHQTALALTAKPYFINAFVQKRVDQSYEMKRLIDLLDATGDPAYRDKLNEYMVKQDYFAYDHTDAFDAENRARMLIKYRQLDNKEGADGLDSARHALRLLKAANLPDTRLIICNTKTEQMYYDIDKMVVEPEFADMKQRVILTCEPSYFATFTYSPQIYNYQKSFLTAVK